MTKEIYKDKIKGLTYEEIIQMDGVLSYPIIVGSTLIGGSAVLGSGNNVLKFNEAEGIFLGNATFASAPFSVSVAGALVATSATITGAITATSGAIGGWNVNATSIYTGTEDHTGYTTNAGDITIYSSGSDASIHAKNFYIDTSGNLTCTGATISGALTATSGAIGGWTLSANAIYHDGATDALSSGMASGDYPFYAGKKYTDRATAPFRVDKAGALVTSTITITGIQAGSSLDMQYALANSIGSAAANLALQSWTIDCAFSSTDLNTVSWGSGTLTLADGETYSITAGNTGDMSARTYIYLDIAESITVLQTTTTPATSVGNGKKLVATAINDTAAATFQVFGGVGGLFVNGDVIAANSIVANQINTSTLSAIAADLGTITAGNITLDSSGYIKGGQSAYNTGTGFWTGYDTDAYKQSIGNADDVTKLMLWDGTDLILNGSPISMNTFFGDGEDGNVTINDAGTTTLTADKFYNNLTITNNSTLDPAGYRVFVKGTTTVDSGSKFGRDGGNGGNGGNGANGTNAGSTGNGGAAGSAGAAGATLGAGTIAGAVASVAGGAGSNGGNGGVWNNNPGGASGNSPAGGNGVSTDPSINVLTAITCTGIGGDGGRGGDSGGSATGAGSGTPGAVGTVGTATVATTRPNTYAFITPLYNVGTTDKLLGAPGNGGSSGGTGGGGGGGNDGNPDTYGCGGGGGTGSGGQGGNGGVMIVVYSKLSGSGTITAALGTAGTKGATIGVKGAAGVTPPSSQSAAGGGAGGGAGGNGSNGGMALLLSRIIVNNGTISCDAGNGGNGGDGGDGGTANYDGNATDGALGTDGKNGVVGKVIQLVV